MCSEMTKVATLTTGRANGKKNIHSIFIQDIKYTKTSAPKWQCNNVQCASYYRPHYGLTDHVDQPTKVVSEESASVNYKNKMKRTVLLPNILSSGSFSVSQKTTEVEVEETLHAKSVLTLTAAPQGDTRNFYDHLKCHHRATFWQNSEGLLNILTNWCSKQRIFTQLAVFLHFSGCLGWRSASLVIFFSVFF